MSPVMKRQATGQKQSLRIAAATLLLLGALAVSTDGHAQTNDAAAAPDTLTGNSSPRQRLEVKGVRTFAILTSEVWDNAAGGLKTGAWYDQLLDFGFQLDTAKLGWWKGGSFLAQAHWVEHSGDASCFDEYTGGFNPVSSIMAGDHLRIFNLYYQQVWMAEAIQLKLGQIAVDDDFMGSDYAGLFLNSAFGAMPSQVGTPLATSCGNSPPFPIYSVAAPGIFLRTRPTESIYSQLGLYYGRPGLDKSSNHGFDWVHETPPELGLFWENGYSYKLAQRPATIRLGLTFHTGELDDFRGTNTGGTPATRQAVPNYYAINDLQLLADRAGRPKLGLFARAGLTPEPNLSMVSLYADGGLNWFAPLPGRPDDAAGVAVSYTQFGSAFRESTGPEAIASGETTVELTYKARVTAWMVLQADLQILFDPARNPDSGSREIAMVVGLRARINF